MSKIKEIWCMPHSHFDVGYTHPQPMLLELQCDYIEQAIDACLKTADYPEEARFRWTCEASYVVKYWLENARPERIVAFRKLVQEGYISVTALPMHTTPGCSAGEALSMMADLDELRKVTGSEIKTAVSHDVNGQPWPLAQFMLDSGVEFYLTGINIHYGGIPFPRPAAFRWAAADGRELCSFVGEHYSLFSQYLFTNERDTARMNEGAQAYIQRLEKNGYDRSFIFLTATNPPQQYDNNPPDGILSDLIVKYNAENYEQKIRLVTPEMLYAKLASEGVDTLPLHSGDWTDYWNFGSASTARELRVNRLAKQALQKAEMLECVNAPMDDRYGRLKRECQKQAVFFDEHTWGACASISSPDAPETYSQKLHKLNMAYQAADLSGYLLSRQMEALCDNPYQSMGLEGIVVVNPTGVPQQAALEVPDVYREDCNLLAATRAKQYIPYIMQSQRKVLVTKSAFMGTVELPPYSWKKIPFSDLDQLSAAWKDALGTYTVSEDTLMTPYYRVSFIPETGRILQIHDLKRGRDILDETSQWGFFEAVRESIDPRFQKEDRGNLYKENVELRNQNISTWNHNWKAERKGAAPTEDCRIERDEQSVSLVWVSQLEGISKIEQRVTFLTWSPRIQLYAKLEKQPVTEPESLYFAFPLKLEEGWQCSYDTMGDYVRLDEEQLGNMCRDYITVDKSISMYDGQACATLFCPDAPMVQAGDFNFAHENRSIERKQNPLLLAWPLNNYWGTNFNANQSGVIELSYEFEMFDKFDAAKIYAESLAAEKMCVVGAAVTCIGEEGSLIQGSGGVVPIYLRPVQAQEGATERTFELLLKNMYNQQEDYQFRVPGSKSIRAEAVTVQGKRRQELPVKDGQISITLPSRGMQLVRVTYEN